MLWYAQFKSEQQQQIMTENKDTRTTPRELATLICTLAILVAGILFQSTPLAAQQGAKPTTVVLVRHA